MIDAVRDPFGFHRVFYDVAGRAHALTIRALLDALPDLPRTLDLAAIAGHLDGAPAPDRTLFEAVRAVPPGHALRLEGDHPSVTAHPPQPQAGDFPALLRASIAETLASGRRCAVALSGGLDSAVVLALVRALGGTTVPAYVLAARLDDYCELAPAQRTAERLGAEVVVVEATAADLAGALPETIRHVEVPLYNPHPVAKLLLARALARDGIEVVLSGDAADHVMGRDSSADYLPLVHALFHAAGVELRSPFLDPRVVAHLLAVPPDPDKQALRDLAATLPVAAELVAGRKVSRLAPPLDLSGLVSGGALATLARLLGRELPPLGDDRQRVLWTTTALLLDAFGAWP
jgi:asparagine synthase (glutamine-hydrolysing)